MDNTDAPLETDVAELKREAQKAVDREVAARVELQAAIDNRVSVRAMIGAGSADALAFIDAYTNPTIANPEPIAPDVAAPAPVEEPPVFTDVSSTDVTPLNSSGGDAEVSNPGLGDEFTVFPPDEFFPPMDAPVADAPATEAPATSADAGGVPVTEDPPVGTAVPTTDGSTT